jgi:RNA polymerase sigma factor (sigma-70 family)
MLEDDAVTCWIDDLKRGSSLAQERLFERYFVRAVRLANRKLGATRRREADEEDIALSAMKSFFAGVDADRFERLSSRDDLWALLAVITSRKAIRQMRRQLSQKRGNSRERGESVFEPGSAGLAAASATESHESEADCREFGAWLLGLLPDPTLRSVALLRLEGLAVDDIASRLGIVPRTVGRKLARIREIWEAAGTGEQS